MAISKNISQSPFSNLPMSPKLILVRHAAVQVNPEVNSHQWELSPDGRSATHQLAPHLQKFDPSHIFTSQEPKAIATGAALADVLALPTQAIPGLQEHDRRGVPYFENKADFETAVSQLFAHPNELLFGNETAVQARERFDTAVNQLYQQFPQETLILTTHGTVLTLFIGMHNTAIQPFQFWQRLTMPFAAILSWPEKQLLHTISV